MIVFLSVFIALIVLVGSVLYLDAWLFKKVLEIAPHRHEQRFYLLEGPEPKRSDFERWLKWHQKKLLAINADIGWFSSAECQRMILIPGYNVFLWLRAKATKHPWPYEEF